MYRSPPKFPLKLFPKFRLKLLPRVIIGCPPKLQLAAIHTSNRFQLVAINMFYSLDETDRKSNLWPLSFSPQQPALNRLHSQFHCFNRCGKKLLEFWWKWSDADLSSFCPLWVFAFMLFFGFCFQRFTLQCNVALRGLFKWTSQCIKERRWGPAGSLRAQKGFLTNRSPKPQKTTSQAWFRSKTENNQVANFVNLKKLSSQRN